MRPPLPGPLARRATSAQSRDVDLPLYVLDDPKPHRRDEDDGERAHTLTHALELIAETFQRSEAVVPGSSPQEIAPPRTDRSSLILRRFLLVTPEVGERRLDEWLARSAGLVRAGTGTWRTIGRLPEEPEDKAIATRRPAAPPLRRIEGRLRLWASPVSVPVVLEMQPWYCSRVVLDLRPERPHEEDGVAPSGDLLPHVARVARRAPHVLRARAFRARRGPVQGPRRDLPLTRSRPRVAPAQRRPATASPPPTRVSSGQGAR